jgi:hypothetical protein
MTRAGFRAAGRLVLPIVLASCALVPLVASVVDAWPSWRPVGDVAIVTTRGRDVLTADTPLLGMPSTVSLAADEQVYHPGPLELWLVGGAQKLSGAARHAGLVAVVAVNALAVGAIVLWLRRLGGLPLLALGGLVTTAWLWSLRGEVITSPLNPHAATLPFAAFLVGVVAARSGVRWAAVGAIAFGSYAAQAHLTVSVIVAAVAAVAVGVAVVSALRQRGPSPERATPMWSRRALAAVLVLAACWIGPVIDVVANGGGNALAVIQSTDDLGEEPTVGFDGARRVVENAIAPRPAWAQAGMDASDLLRRTSAARQLVAAGLVGVAIALAVACRRRHPVVTTAVVVAISAIVAGTYVVSRIPINVFNRFATHNYLWVWAVSALLWGAIACGIGAVVRDKVGVQWRAELRAGVVIVCSALAIVAAAASLGAPHRAVIVNRTFPYVAALAPDVRRALDESMTYTMNLSDDINAYDIATALLDDLDRHGFTITVPSEDAPSFGERRAVSTTSEGGRLIVLVSLDPLVPPEGARTITSFEPARGDLERLAAAERDVVDVIQRGGGFISADFAEVNAQNAPTFVHERFATLAVLGWLPDRYVNAPETDEFLSALSRPVRRVGVYLVE